MTEFRFEEPLDVYKENIAVVGEHYSGKTYFATHHIIKPLLKTREVNLWFWNHNALHLDLFEPHQIVYYLDDLQRGTQCYVPESKSEEHFNEFCKLVQQLTNHHIVFDELHDFMSAQFMEKELKPVIRDMPANNNVTYTAIWQRAAEGHKSVMSNARHKFLFNYDPVDQEKYLQLFGKKADLFLEPEERKFFRDEASNGKKYRYKQLEQHSFIYRDKKQTTKVDIYNGGHLTQIEDLKIEI